MIVKRVFVALLMGTFLLSPLGAQDEGEEEAVIEGRSANSNVTGLFLGFEMGIGLGVYNGKSAPGLPIADFPTDHAATLALHLGYRIIPQLEINASPGYTYLAMTSILYINPGVNINSYTAPVGITFFPFDFGLGFSAGAFFNQDFAAFLIPERAVGNTPAEIKLSSPDSGDLTIGFYGGITFTDLKASNTGNFFLRIESYETALKL